MKKVQGLFGQPTKVVNIGIEAFYDDLKAQNVPVIQMRWSAPSEDDKRNQDLANKLAALLGR